MFNLPYSHQAALAQYPVPFELGKELVQVYPLTVGAILDLNLYLQNHYYRGYKDKIDALPDEMRDEFDKKVQADVSDLTFQSGKGYDYFMTNKDCLVRLINHLTHNTLSQDKIDEYIFKFDVYYAQVIVNAMRSCVFRPIPESPKLNVTRKDPKYETTDEESEARLYKILADKFGWSYKDILDLTDYQIFWYTYMYPEEREHIEELDALSHKNDDNGTNGRLDVPYQPGTIHFNSPEEYEAWLATRPPKE